MLLNQYIQTGNMYDLEAAIFKTELAVPTTLEYYQNQAIWLNNLVNMLSNRYNQIKNMHDFGTAILRAELALSLNPKNHLD